MGIHNTPLFAAKTTAIVMAGLVPAIHVLTAEEEERRGYPGQARA
jgi:hypothetical protein